MWMRRDWMAAGLAAVTAFGLTAGSYWSLGAVARNGQAPTVVINEPTLTVDGCRVKVRLASSGSIVTRNGANLTIAPGPVPQFELEAVNPGNAAATIHVTASLQISSERDLMSRVPRPAPAPVWHEELTLSVPAGHTQVLPLATGAKIDAMGVATLKLEAGNQQITTLTLSALPPPAAGRPISAKLAEEAGHGVAQAAGR